MVKGLYLETPARGLAPSALHSDRQGVAETVVETRRFTNPVPLKPVHEGKPPPRPQPMFETRGDSAIADSDAIARSEVPRAPPQQWRMRS